MSLQLLGIAAEGEALVLDLVERIERCRALQPEESDLVAELVRRSRRRAGKRVYRRWTKKEDDELWRRQFKALAVAQYAEMLGITQTAAWSRLRHLRNLRKGRRQEGDVGNRRWQGAEVEE